MKNKVQELYALEQLAAGETHIHRLHPLVKLLATLVFIVTVVSVDRYDPVRLIPFVMYPMIIMALSETPYTMLFKRFLVTLPFCLFAGISNVVFNRTAAFSINGLTVSWGVISIAAILFRTYLCVMAVLILVSVTPLSELTKAMRQLRISNIFIVMFEMTYRYIGVLIHEVYSMGIAYSLRNTGRKGIDMRDIGVFGGQLLIRSFSRAERIYNAMQCRGYTLKNIQIVSRKPVLSDIVFLFVICLLCATFRFINMNRIF